MKKFTFFITILFLITLITGCTTGGITTPGGTTVSSSAKITTFKVESFTPGEKIKLIWNIEGTYDAIRLSRKEADGTYTVIMDTGRQKEGEILPTSYEDTDLAPKKVYIYKLEVLSNNAVQDTKRYIIFSSTDPTQKARFIYNINLDDPDNHKYSVDMWIDTGMYDSVILKTIANHNQDVKTLRVTSWSSMSYSGSLSGDPNNEVTLSGKGLYFIHYVAELPPVVLSEPDILGLFTTRFFLSANSQHLLLLLWDQEDKFGKAYKTYNTLSGWEVYSPEEPLDDNTYIIDTDDIDGCYNAYQEDSVLAVPKGTFESRMQTIYGTQVNIVLDKKIPNYTKYYSYMFKIFENECWIFGEGVGKRYGVYVVHYNTELYTSENTYSQGYSDKKEVVSEMYTHQIFHRWNGFPPYDTKIEPEDGYFRGFYSESWNNYFNDWNRTQVLPDYNWDDMKRYYKVYRAEYLNTSKDVPVATYGTGDPFIWYEKGPLVVYLLNKEIERVTNGEKSMVDVQREIWNRYGHENGTFNYEDIIEVINEVTGADFHQFFNDYVFGTKEIKIPEFE